MVHLYDHFCRCSDCVSYEVNLSYHIECDKEEEEKKRKAEKTDDLIGRDFGFTCLLWNNK